MELHLPEGFSARPPTMDDAAAVAALLTACAQADGDVTGVNVGLITSDWREEGFDLERDAVLVFAPDGTLAASGDLFAGETHLEMDNVVLPPYTGRGIGTALMAWVEARARERATQTPGDSPITLNGAFHSTNTAARGLYEAAGFTPVRYFLHMHRRLEAPPDAPVLAEGVTLRRFERNRDERAMYETMEDAFEDHWDHTRPPYEEWIAAKLDPDVYDPTLWFLAEANGETVGVILNRNRGGTPWVQGLGVRRDWRGRGIGLALLQQTFAEFYARGLREIALNVDAHSLTGATRLYERAGMTVASRFDLYRKTLREGRTSP